MDDIPMSVSIVPRRDLATEKLKYLEERLAAPEHVGDPGAIRSWHTHPASMLIVIDNVTGLPVGLVEVSGPRDKVGIAWWLDLRYRRKGVGKAMIDELVVYLKAIGVSGVAPIIIDPPAGEYTAASTKLAQRLRVRFPLKTSRR
jgi:GNAT superfamily N-acetyltransferase